MPNFKTENEGVNDNKIVHFIYARTAESELVFLNIFKYTTTENHVIGNMFDIELMF